MPINSASELLAASLLVLVLLVALAYILYRRLQSRRALVARLAELSALSDFGRAVLGAQFDLGRLADLIYRRAGEIVDTTFFQLGLFEGDRYRLLVWIVDDETRPAAEFRLTPDSLGIVGWLRQSRQALLVRDFEAERDRLPARPRYVSSNPPRSAVFVPLLAGEAALGAMAIQSRRAGAFSEEDLRLLTIIANSAAAALENARLFEQARRRAAQLQLLADISQKINVLQPLPALYRQVVDLVAQKFGEYTVSFFEAVDGWLHLRATNRAEWEGRLPPVAFGDGLAGHAALARQPMISQALPEYSPDAPAPALPEESELAVPVEIEARVLGVLAVRSRGGGALDETVVSLFKSVAAQMAFAILEAEVYTAEQRRAEQMHALAQASRTMATTLELGDLLDEVLDLIDEGFGYRRARVFLLHESDLVLRAVDQRWEGEWAQVGRAYPIAGPGLVPLAGRLRQRVVAADAHQHPDFAPEHAPPDVRAELALPLLMGDHLLGVLDVQSERPGAFTEDDVQTLQALADTLAVAVRNARLFESERRRRRLAETLREVSAALTSTLSLEGVLDLILSGLAHVINYDVASILLVNDAGEVTLRAINGLDAADALGLPLSVALLPSGAGLPATLPIAELDPDGEYRELFGLPDPHASLGAVLAVHDEHIGYLIVDQSDLDRFAPDEVELIAAFASQASVAIENARLYTAQREQAWVSTALLQVAEATGRAGSLTEVLDTVVRLTPLLVGVDRCAMLLADGADFRLEAYYAAAEEPAAVEPGARVAVDDWPRLRDLIENQNPIVLDPEDALPAAFQGAFRGVVILLPLLAKGVVQGAMVVGQAAGVAPFTTHRVRLIGGIASQAALAVESALLDQAQQEEAWVSTALLQVAEAVAGRSTLDEALETVARLTPMLVGIERVGIYQWDSAAETFFPLQIVGADSTTLALAAADLGVDPQAASALAVVHPVEPPVAVVFGAPLCMTWPLWARGDMLGALVIPYVAGLGRRQNILTGIANQLAMAMESARLARELVAQRSLEHEMEVGRDIQASFLPNSYPQAPGWDISAYWQAARLVGGDFYDFIPLRSKAGAERWGIVVADVSDKGVPAALFMALSRTLLRSVAIGRISPAATLTRVNELLFADVRSNQFVTIFYGVWEPAAGRFTYANGGHNPPVLMGTNGQARLLREHNMALGVMDDIQYEEHEVTLAPGETLLIYTDGLTDAIDADEVEFGLDRVRAVLAASRDRSAADMVLAIEAAVQAHVGLVEAFDDQTMVVVKREAG